MVHEMTLSNRLARRALLASSALAATCVLPQTAGAQAFQGTPSVVSGGPVITTGTGTTSVVLTAPETVINWTPTDVSGTGTIDFLPSGTVASFSDEPAVGLTRYTVLNRILPVDAAGVPTARSVAFNGTVQSFLGGNQGGEIWFYSPTGIIAGATSVFNVGSLVLTTDDIDTTGGLFSAAGAIRFRGPAGSTGTVSIQSGAQINTVDPNTSYVALVAPRVVQGGTIQADGSVALVAAEQADITFSAGLVDVQITQGSTDANGIVHTGTTGGPASTGLTDVQQVKLVAMPKNTAMTMLLSGSIGYTPAAVAAQDGSSVILSAGYDPNLPAATLAQGLGNLAITNAAFTNQLTANATGALDIMASGGGLVDFQADATLTGGQMLTAIAAAGSEIQARASLTLAAGLAPAGGTVTLEAQGPSGALPAGSVNIASQLTLNALGAAIVPNTPFVTAPDSTGSTINLLANGGTIDAATIMLDATAQGAFGTGQGGGATGGDVHIVSGYGGRISAATLFAFAGATGGDSNGAAGSATGGTIDLRDTGTGAADTLGGTLQFADVFLNASGSGGVGNTINGNATGGAISIGIASQSQNWNSLFVNADAFGGGAFVGGSVAGSAQARPDAVTLDVSGKGNLNVLQDLALSADASAGVEGGATSFANAGGINVNVASGGLLQVGGTTTITADAKVDIESYSADPATSPSLLGGTVNVLADGGTINTADFTATARAEGAGATGAAGLAQGGDVQVGALNGGTFRAAAGSAPVTFRIDADALGSGGVAPANAEAGSATLYASDGTVDIQGTAVVSASALAGNFDGLVAGTGFDATGGDASVELRTGTSGTGQLLISTLSVQANADGGAGTTPAAGVTGDGGNAAAGVARLALADGTFVLGDVAVNANGTGGQGANGGDGSGGDAGFLLTDTLTGANSPRSIASLSLMANGTAGTGTTGVAGSDIAGVTRLTAQTLDPGSGVTVAGDFTASANGATAPAGNGFVGNVSGADFTVLGKSDITTSRDVAISVGSGAAFHTAGTLSITTPRTLTGTGAGTIAADAGVSLLADLGINLTNLQSGATSQLIAVSGPVVVSHNLVSTGLVTVLGQSVDLTSLAGLSFADAQASAGDLAIHTAGDLDVATVDATGSVTLASSGGSFRNTGLVTGNNITINAAGSIETDSIVRAANTLTAMAGGTFNGFSLVVGRTMTIGGSDIVLDGQLGQRGTTQTLTLINTAPAGRTTVGGFGESPGWTLSNVELGEVFADKQITFTVPAGTTAAAAGDFVLGDFGLAFGETGTLGTGGTLKIATPGRVEIPGAIRLITSSADDTFSIDPSRIDVIGDTGSIIMNDALGNLLGRLNLTGGVVAVASQAVIDGIAKAGSTQAITDLLGTTLASAPPSGVLQAGQINFDVTGGLFIQNVGETTVFSSRRGFSANSVSIISRSAATQIVINGVSYTAAGTPVTGIDTMPTVLINGIPAVVTGAFDPYSSINGCVIGFDCMTPGRNPTPSKPGYEGPLHPDGSQPTVNLLSVVEVSGHETIGSPPLIDEPVTGIGNDDLWFPQCDKDSKCEAKGDGQ